MDDRHLNDVEYDALYRALQLAKVQLNDAYEQLARSPTQRAAYILARATNIDEGVVREVLDALAHGDYNARASELIVELVDEIERYRAGYLGEGE